MQNTNQTDEDGFTNFEPISFYDAPGVLAKNLFDGNTSAGQAYRAYHDSYALAPKERESLASEMKKKYGGNVVLDTVIDVALNPLVWFAAATSIPGLRGFVSSAGKFTQGRASVDGKVAGRLIDWFTHLGLTGVTTGAHHHAPTDGGITHLANIKSILTEQERVINGAQRGAILDHVGALTGVKDLDPTKHSKENADTVHAINLHLALSASGRYSNSIPRDEMIYAPTRVAKVSDGKTQSYVILPAEKPGKSKELYSKGKSIGRLQIVEEPYTVNSLESYEQAQLDLGPKVTNKTGWWITSTPSMELRKKSVPFTEQEYLSMLRSRGVNTDIVKAYSDSSQHLFRHLGNHALGETPEGLNTILGVNETIKGSINKLDRIANVHVDSPNSILNELSPNTQAGLDEIPGDLVSAILPNWVQEGVARGKIRKTQVSELLKRTYQNQLDAPRFFPGTVHAKYEVSNSGRAQRLEAEDVVTPPEQGFENATKQARSVILSKGTSDHVDPKDWERISNLMAPHLNPNQVKIMEQLYERSHNYVSDKIQKNEVATTTSLDHERGFRQYVQEMSGQITFHSYEPPAELNGLLEQAISAPKIADSRKDQDKVILEPPAPNEYRKKTLNLLGVTEKSKELNRTTMGAYTRKTEINRAARHWLERWKDLEKRIDIEKDPDTVTTLMLQRPKLQAELDFINSYKHPHSTSFAIRKPESMQEFFQVLMGIENQPTRESLQGYVFPRMFGGAKTSHFVAKLALDSVRNAADTYAKSEIGLWAKDNLGTIGAQAHAMAAAHAERPVYMKDAANLTSTVAGYIYATHLSAMMTTLGNLTQPIIYGASRIGLWNTLKLYPEAISELYAYKKERMAMGLAMDPHARDLLIKKHIPLTNYRGMSGTEAPVDLVNILSGDVSSTLDNALVGSSLHKTPNWFTNHLVSLPLIPFQSGEQLNRLISAKSALKYFTEMSKQSGMPISSSQMVANVRNFQSSVNFSGGIGTRPRILSDPDFAGPLGKWLTNPIGGMFLQFPIRSITQVAEASKEQGGKMGFGFGNVGGPSIPINASLGLIMKQLGLSAVLYESAKNLIGTDFSNQLAANSYGGLGPMITGQQGPPALSIPVNLYQGLVDGDKDKLRQSLFRILPAGIPLSKMVGVLPPIPLLGGEGGILQSQYADWTKQDGSGNIPVYKSDGSLLSFQSPLELVMKGVGFEPKKWNSLQDASKFLIANRQEITTLKRQYKDAILGNNFAGASAIEADYKKRFGVSITVKNSEWDSAIKLREVGLTERLVDSMPTDLRNQYQQSLSGFESQLGLDPNGLQSGDTAKAREPMRNFSSGLIRPNLTDDTGG